MPQRSRSLRVIRLRSEQHRCGLLASIKESPGTSVGLRPLCSSEVIGQSSLQRASTLTIAPALRTERYGSTEKHPAQTVRCTRVERAAKRFSLKRSLGNAFPRLNVEGSDPFARFGTYCSMSNANPPTADNCWPLAVREIHSDCPGTPRGQSQVPEIKA